MNDTAFATARAAALEAAEGLPTESTALIPFVSQGQLLIIGALPQALDCIARLPDSLTPCVLVPGPGSTEAVDAPCPVFYSHDRPLNLKGQLGRFDLQLEGEQPIYLSRVLEPSQEHFDLVLDLQATPLIDLEMLPLGYFAPADDEQLQEALTALPELVGEFDKPTFFHYEADICAHGRNGLKGCTRCLDACPSGAITSLVETIAVDPLRCQGGGSCATACPSGAIIYSYPKPADIQNRLRVLLRTYREADGEHPVLLFHDGEAGQAMVEALGDALLGYVIPIEVEEVGAVGMDLWLTALAYGASRVLLLTPPRLASSIQHELEAQLATAQALLAELDYPREAVALLSELAPSNWLSAPMPSFKPATFAGSNVKRDGLFFAIDWLAKAASRHEGTAPLPPQAPFGEIQVNRDTCTLCMACVAVCPSHAIADGGDRPALQFLEANCVQCGLCEIACPENAITRHSRFQFDREARRQQRILNEEPAFHCINCGTPFATLSLIEKMTAKLEGHWMFADGKALRRLKMCGDCRVKAMFEEEGRL